MENMEDSGFDSDHKSNQTGLLNVSEKNPRLGIAICSRIILTLVLISACMASMLSGHGCMHKRISLFE